MPTSKYKGQRRAQTPTNSIDVRDQLFCDVHFSPLVRYIRITAFGRTIPSILFLAKGARIKHLFSILMLPLTTTYKVHSTRPPGIGCRYCRRIPSTPASCCNATGTFFFFFSNLHSVWQDQPRRTPKVLEGRRPEASCSLGHPGKSCHPIRDFDDPDRHSRYSSTFFETSGIFTRSEIHHSWYAR